ncbi:MAG: hypothetical protein PHS04_00335 [Tissierellia bacterium]|nr:hypothetical protein [Tissierellia bacterium]
MKRCFALRQRWLFTKKMMVVLITPIGTDGSVFNILGKPDDEQQLNLWDGRTG